MGQCVAIRCDGVVKTVIAKPLLAWETMEFYHHFAGYSSVVAENEAKMIFKYHEACFDNFQEWFNHG